MLAGALAVFTHDRSCPYRHQLPFRKDLELCSGFQIRIPSLLKSTIKNSLLIKEIFEGLISFPVETGLHN
jgi:hypothetical protein